MACLCRVEAGPFRQANPLPPSKSRIALTRAPAFGQWLNVGHPDPIIANPGSGGHGALADDVVEGPVPEVGGEGFPAADSGQPGAVQVAVGVHRVVEQERVGTDQKPSVRRFAQNQFVELGQLTVVAVGTAQPYQGIPDVLFVFLGDAVAKAIPAVSSHGVVVEGEIEAGEAVSESEVVAADRKHNALGLIAEFVDLWLVDNFRPVALAAAGEDVGNRGTGACGPRVVGECVRAAGPGARVIGVRGQPWPGGAVVTMTERVVANLDALAGGVGITHGHHGDRQLTRRIVASLFSTPGRVDGINRVNRINRVDWVNGIDRVDGIWRWNRPVRNVVDVVVGRGAVFDENPGSVRGHDGIAVRRNTHTLDPRGRHNVEHIGESGIAVDVAPAATGHLGDFVTAWIELVCGLGWAVGSRAGHPEVRFAARLNIDEARRPRPVPVAWGIGNLGADEFHRRDVVQAEGAGARLKVNARTVDRSLMCHRSRRNIYRFGDDEVGPTTSAKLDVAATLAPVIGPVAG